MATVPGRGEFHLVAPALPPALPEPGNHQDRRPHHVLQHHGMYTRFHLDFKCNFSHRFCISTTTRYGRWKPWSLPQTLSFSTFKYFHPLSQSLSQNNRISRLSGLEKLKKLKKLYLTKNRIQVFEGLTTNKHLEEVSFQSFSISVLMINFRCTLTDKT